MSKTRSVDHILVSLEKGIALIFDGKKEIGTVVSIRDANYEPILFLESESVAIVGAYPDCDKKYLREAHLVAQYRPDFRKSNVKTIFLIVKDLSNNYHIRNERLYVEK